jgi:hypothetical protein
MLQQLLNGFAEPEYGKVRRSDETYKTVARHCSTHLVRLVNEYRAGSSDKQLLRELRNDMDYYLRRYHAYCIKERNHIDAHYHEVGADDNVDFEHLIPAARIRDLLIGNVLTVEQALNAPTVRLSRDKHRALKTAGLASYNPNMWLPFQRYTQVFTASYQTYDGTTVDPTVWTLEKHYEHFAHLTIGI